MSRTGASTRRSRPTARARTATTSSPSARSSRARTSRTRLPRRSCSAPSSASSARAGGAASRRKGPPGSSTRRTRSCPRSTAARPCSSIPRASRGSASRCSRRWRAERRASSRRIHRSTRRRAMRRCGPTRTTPMRSRPRSSAHARSAATVSPAGSSTRVALPGSRTAERTWLRGSDEGRGRRHTARADARGNGPLPRVAPAARRARGDGRAAARLRPRAGGDVVARPRVVPARAASPRARRRRPPLPLVPWTGPQPHAARGHRPRPRRLPAAGGVPAVDEDVQPRGRPSRRARSPHRRRGIGVHRLGAGDGPARAARAHSRRPECRCRGVLRGGASREWRLRARGRNARAAQEPRPRDRGGAAARARAARRGDARLGRRRGGRPRRLVARLRHRRRPRAALPRRALRRLSVAVRGLRHSGARGDGVRRARRDLARRRHGGGRRRRSAARRSARRRVHRRRHRGGDRATRRAPCHRPPPRARLLMGRVGEAPAEYVPDGGCMIVVDADFLGRRRTGDETYVRELLRALPRDLDVAAVTRRPDLVPEGVRAIELDARLQELRMAWALPRLLRRLRPRLAHFVHAIPPALPCPAVLTVQDLSFERDPTTMGRRERLIFKTVVPWSARRAAHIFAISERTRDDLVELYGVPVEKITVTPLAPAPEFRPAATSEHDGYLLFVSSVERRKDPLAALAAARALGMPLVVVGPQKDHALAQALRDG